MYSKEICCTSKVWTNKSGVKQGGVLFFTEERFMFITQANDGYADTDPGWGEKSFTAGQYRGVIYPAGD